MPINGVTATIDYRELRQDDYPLFREMLAAYYREGEDADTEQQMRLAGAEHFYVSVYPLADKFWTRCGYAKTENTASNGLFIYKK